MQFSTMTTIIIFTRFGSIAWNVVLAVLLCDVTIMCVRTRFRAQVERDCWVILPVTVTLCGRSFYSKLIQRTTCQIDSENRLLSKMEDLLSSRLKSFEQKISKSQRQISDTQLTKIQQNFVSNHSHICKQLGSC